MPFYPGSEADKRSRRAITGNSWGESAGILPQLSGKDTFFGAAGERWPVDVANPSFALLARQNQVARTAADLGQYDTPLPSFIGKDVFFASPGIGPDYDYPNPSFAVLARQNFVARTANDVGQWANPIPTLIGPFQQFPPGADVYDLAPRATLRAREYGQTSSFPLELIGQDQRNAGAQSQDLPAKAAARARDYSITASFPLELLGQDAFNPGQQITGNAPAGAARASTLSEPGVNLTILLTPVAASFPQGQASLDQQYRTVPRARDYSLAVAFPLQLIGQDALAAGLQLSGNAPATVLRAREYTWLQSFALETIGPQQQFPVGLDYYDLAPVGAARSRDYSFTAAFFQGLIGQDALPTGVQLSGNAPAAPRRAVDYTWTQSFPLSLIGKDQFNAGQSAQDQQYRLTPRARDYSFTAGFFHGLDGQDAVTAGRQLSGNAPAGALRASTLSETGSNQILGLVALPPVFPCGQSTAATELPPRTAARARDYTFTASFLLELVGKDLFFSVGGPAYDYPNPSFARLIGAQRTVASLSADVGQWASPIPELIGQDKFFDTPGQGLVIDWTPPVRTIPRSFALYDPGVNATILLPVATVGFPPGAQFTDLPPKASARSRDYSFTASYFAGLIGQDALPTGEQVSGNAPAGARRSTEYTFLASFPLFLIGQDQMAAGAQAQDLPPRPTPRSREYGQTAGFPLELIGKDQLPTGDSTASSENPPRAPQRANDYTFFQTLPLYIFQQLPPGRSTAATEGPPRAPARSRDYTWLQSLKPYLIGQDAMATGEQSLDQQYRVPARLVDYTWIQSLGYGPLVAAPPVFPCGEQVFDLPPAGALRLAAAGYSHTAGTPFSLVARTRDVIHVMGAPQAKWVIGRIPVSSRWRIEHPRP